MQLQIRAEVSAQRVGVEQVKHGVWTASWSGNEVARGQAARHVVDPGIGRIDDLLESGRADRDREAKTLGDRPGGGVCAPAGVLSAAPLTLRASRPGRQRLFMQAISPRDDQPRQEGSQTPGYRPKKSSVNPTVSTVPCAIIGTQRLRPALRYSMPNTRPLNPAIMTPEAP